MTTTSRGTKLGIRKITARIGAEVTGVDPASELDPETVTESRDILRLLQAYVARPENVLRLAWQPDQLVLFDNRITQHYAIDNYDDAPRRLNRVTVAGDVPVGIDGRPSYSVKGDASHYTPVAVVPAAA